MEIIDLEDPDFQAPIIPATTDVSKKRSIEEEEEEEENTPERLNCSLCELPWTTQGAHRIVHLKCGDVFGKRQIANKKDMRIIWPTKVLAEDESEMKRLKNALEESKNILETYLNETLLVQKQLQECRNELAAVKADEILQLKAEISTANRGLSDNSHTTQSKEFQLCRSYVSGTEKYRTMTVLPLFETIVVSAEQPRNNSHGIRKINLFNTTLTTSLDKTLKLTSLTNNVTVQTYTLEFPGWSCAFDDHNTNLLYCGLGNNTLMVYDIRNTRSHLHKLKDSSSQAPIHSLNVGQVNDSHSAVLCSNLVQSYVWNFKKDGDTPSYIPIETTPEFKPFHSYYQNGKLLTSSRNKDTTEYVISHSSDTSTCCFDTNIDWSYTTNFKQTSLTRNSFFERNDELFICFAEADTKPNIKGTSTLWTSPNYEIQFSLILFGGSSNQNLIARQEELIPSIKLKPNRHAWIYVGNTDLIHAFSRTYIAWKNIISDIYFNDSGSKTKWKKPPISHTIALSSFLDGFDNILKQEIRNCIHKIIDLANFGRGVNPSSFVRLAVVNVMLSITYGHPSTVFFKSALYQKIASVVDTYHKLGGSFETRSFLNDTSRHDFQMFMYTKLLPLIHQLIGLARESKLDNLVKQLDKIECQLDKDGMAAVIVAIPSM
ncbi:hypothetical protein G6F57_010836 [Rhizopus arrhizus]|uniref:RING-type E3 ubiquitin transferase n=1 Tax=Rhizopus oryzae TaxID=64495 RepID=A0A9P7BMJ5_RHIOR|nr:hypothetical protein G6F23_007286 [Rhizopus arrhizus]KAG1411364.1 hypothetical protein G6F58_008589 [Rhizopus delemar]KAG0783184.1 hypothetical protein G6F21_010679 [Rhizopus arrhizus]KAG0818990.1 hypothetical protein G6F20_001103 [Rhizopus arrhizus]KAG0828571.1 hypothetical protein G6F19_008172 [Rhizopus arrhizus]